MKNTSKRKKNLIALLLGLFILCMMTLPVQASETSGKIKILKGSGKDEITISLTVRLPVRTAGEFRIYRSADSTSLKEESSLLSVIPLSEKPEWYRQDKGYVLRLERMRDTGVDLYSAGKKLSGKVTITEVGLEANSAWCYQIAYVNEQGTERFRSNILKVSTVPYPVTLIKCHATSLSSVVLSWLEADNADGYGIYRKSGETWNRLKNITDGKVTTFTDTGVKAGETCWYKVRAYRVVDGKTVYGQFGDPLKATVQEPTVAGTYTPGSVYGPSLNSTQLQEVRRVVQGFKDAFITDTMSDYDKAYLAYRYLRDNCAYAWRGWQYNNANTAWGALVYGEAQCSGYARAMKALCDGIGVPCYYVHASGSSANPSHQWNFVQVEGNWYVVDAQGGYFLAGSRIYQDMAGMRWDPSGLPPISVESHRKAVFFY